MARGKHKGSNYYCGICEESFSTWVELNHHVANHPDSSTPELSCSICDWPFSDSLALETHKLQAGHGAAEFTCEDCNRSFISQPSLLQHQQPPYGCQQTLPTSTDTVLPNGRPPRPPRAMVAAITCDRCLNTFSSQREYSAHRSWPDGSCTDYRQKKTPPKQQQQKPFVRPGYLDSGRPASTPNTFLGYDECSDVSDDSNLSDEGKKCSKCRKVFRSEGQYNNHFLGCRTPPGDKKPGLGVLSSTNRLVITNSSDHVSAIQPRHILQVKVPNPNGPRSTAEASRPMQNVALNTKPPVLQCQSTRTQGQALISSIAPSQNPQSPTPAVGNFVCSADGCNKTFRSEKGLKVHQVDIHGIGGQALDIQGKNSWMLGPRERERLRAEGLLQSPAAVPRSHSGRPLPFRAPPMSVGQASPSPTARPSAMPAARTVQASQIPSVPRHPMPQHAPVQQMPMPAGMTIGGPDDMEQAKFIQGKILRLLIQSDIFVKHGGGITVCGLDWTRIGVSCQNDVIEMFEGLCHLPKILQGEYLPPPKTFKDEYINQYPSGEFEPSPIRNSLKPGLDVIVLSCSKVVLADGFQEVVKIAAVDLVTCRILMNHLVCTDPDARVVNWRSPVTGLFGWHDMELARQAGYKVFKGWSAARSALWKFVDKETIIVGHNLRSDLDALRIVHGRAVDVAKVVEKAAKGTMSKIQLSLDSLCRDYADVHLKSDPEYGRDTLMNAFAARQFMLWACKNEARLNKEARQRSMDYEKIMPRANLVA